jgi:hypothetical protein
LPISFGALTEYSENNSTVPKKSKNLKNENKEVGAESASAKAAKPARRRTSTSTKKTKATRKTSAPAQATKSPTHRKSSSVSPPTDEEIQLRAYFISECRHRLDLAGDASSDWLEAKRQLLSEVGPR